MADQANDTGDRQDNFLPPPPPFYLDFTPENLARFEDLRATAAERNGAPPEQTRLSLVELPEELINLQPPLPPEDGRWRCFGDNYSLHNELPTLEEQNIERLVPDNTANNDVDRLYPEREAVLKRCAKSLLLSFFELVSVLKSDPWAGWEKCNDIRTLFINFHHAINEYRPHQARESLIQHMQDQLDKLQAETQANRQATEQARKTLEGLASIEVPDDQTLFPPQYPEVAGSQIQSDGMLDASLDVSMEPEEAKLAYESLVWRREEQAWRLIDEGY